MSAREVLEWATYGVTSGPLSLSGPLSELTLAEDCSVGGIHIQGYLAHKKPRAPRTLQQDYA